MSSVVWVLLAAQLCVCSATTLAAVRRLGNGVGAKNCSLIHVDSDTGSTTHVAVLSGVCEDVTDVAAPPVVNSDAKAGVLCFATGSGRYVNTIDPTTGKVIKRASLPSKYGDLTGVAYDAERHWTIALTSEVGIVAVDMMNDKIVEVLPKGGIVGIPYTNAVSLDASTHRLFYTASGNHTGAPDQLVTVDYEAKVVAAAVPVGELRVQNVMRFNAHNGSLNGISGLTVYSIEPSTGKYHQVAEFPDGDGFPIYADLQVVGDTAMMYIADLEDVYSVDLVKHSLAHQTKFPDGYYIEGFMAVL